MVACAYIPTIPEVEIKRIVVKGQSRKRVSETSIPTNKPGMVIVMPVISATLKA